MGYTDLTSTFAFKSQLKYQDFQNLANNDAYLLALFAAYRRPVLQFNSATTVNVENNTGTLNQTAIMFPDATLRTVTEDLASTQKYRRFDTTKTAQFTTGTESGGVRSGESLGNNTWWAIYAVKSLINAANFVLVASQTYPTQANFATLNTNFGTNGWAYLGLILYGDNSAAGASIPDFVQVGNTTVCKNTATGQIVNGPGASFANNNAATVTWTYAAGSLITQIPAHLTMLIFAGITDVVAQVFICQNSAGTRSYQRVPGDKGAVARWVAAAAEGVKLSNGGGTAVKQEVFVVGWIDPVLGVGPNPQL